MLKLGDVGVLAEGIEKCLPEIAKNNNGEDIRHRIKVSVQVSKDELNSINSELYEITNHRLPEDLPEVDLISLDLVGITFELLPSGTLL